MYLHARSLLNSSIVRCGVSLCYICYSLANVSFDLSVYGADEDNGSAQPVLVLSNPLSTDIIVHVNATDGSATGQYLLL